MCIYIRNYFTGILIETVRCIIALSGSVANPFGGAQTSVATQPAIGGTASNPFGGGTGAQNMFGGAGAFGQPAPGMGQQQMAGFGQPAGAFGQGGFGGAPQASATPVMAPGFGGAPVAGGVPQSGAQFGQFPMQNGGTGFNQMGPASSAGGFPQTAGGFPQTANSAGGFPQTASSAGGFPQTMSSNFSGAMNTPSGQFDNKLGGTQSMQGFPTGWGQTPQQQPAANPFMVCTLDFL